MMRLFLLCVAGVVIPFSLLIFLVIIPEKREANRIRAEQRTWCTDHGYANASITEKHGSGKNSYTLDQVLCMDKDRRLILPE
jgi:hypothetical protein